MGCFSYVFFLGAFFCSKSKEKKFHLEKGMTLLHICAQFSNNVAMRLLIQKGANVNLLDSLGCTAFHRAGLGNNAEGVQILIEAGNSFGDFIDKKSKQFGVRSFQPGPWFFFVLPQAGCNPYVIDGFGSTAMRPTCCFGNLDSLQALLQHAPNMTKAGALHFSAVGEGSPQIIIPELLLAGAGFMVSSSFELVSSRKLEAILIKFLGVATGADINEHLHFPLKMRTQLRLLATMARWLDARNGKYLFFFLTNFVGSLVAIFGFRLLHWFISLFISSFGFQCRPKDPRR